MSIYTLLPKRIRQLLRWANTDNRGSDDSFLISKIDKNLPSRGTELFDRQHYQDINDARMKHLESLELQLEMKSVLDVGCGPGHLAQFFINNGCNVTCVDAREENIKKLRSQYTGITTYVADIQTKQLNKIGTFDIVFCYGLLYHLENPIAALRNIKSACKELLLLETIICDHKLPVSLMIDEPPDPTQALRGLACRPSPSYITMALNQIGFPFIYKPKMSPEHPQFRFHWKNNLEWKRDGHPIRCIFVASMTELQNPNLISLLKG